jgi:hypothetical protein
MKFRLLSSIPDKIDKKSLKNALGFFHESVSSRPLSTPLGPFKIFTKIHGDIPSFVFIVGINGTGDKVFTGVNDSGDKLSCQAPFD